MADISQIVLKDSSGNVIGTYNVKDTSVPHDSKAAVSGGTKLSLVTTGEKATWNAKADTDTKNTAGATNTTSKMYLIGARSQDTNPQTYSNSDTYYELGTIHAHKFKAHYSNDSVIIDGNGIVQCRNANNVAMSHISSGSDYYGGRAGLKDPTGTFDAVSLSGKDGLVCKSDDNTTTIQLNCSNGNITAAGGLKINGTEDVASIKGMTEWKTSTTSFVNACSLIGIYSGIGNVLDNLKTNISSYTNNTTNTRVDSTQGPMYFMWFGKASDKYFTGMLLSYFDNASPERKSVLFAYYNGTYQVRLI